MGIGKMLGGIADAVRGAGSDFVGGIDDALEKRAAKDVFGPDTEVSFGSDDMARPGLAKRAGRFVGENPYKTGIGASLGGLLGLSAVQTARTSSIVDEREAALGRPMTQSEAYEAFLEAGMDNRMAREMASIYVRERGGTV